LVNTLLYCIANIGQPVLITMRQIQTGEELTADYGPHYASIEDAGDVDTTHTHTHIV
jgi:hypothetical protein